MKKALQTLFTYLKNWHWSSYLLSAILVFFLIQRVPLMWSMYQTQGQTAPHGEVFDGQGQRQSIPLPGQNHILVFWATWCGPCKVELSRINSMIEKEQIDGKNILAISLGEEPEIVFKHAAQEGYRFPIAVDPQWKTARPYGVAGTPTIMFVNAKGIITWKTMGLSPSLELRVSQFLKNQ